MKKIAKYFRLTALIGILLLSLGCTEDSNEESISVGKNSAENIRALLQEKFNGPNEKLGKIWDGLNPNNPKKQQKYEKKLDEYIEENIEPYYSERLYDPRTATYPYRHLHSAHKSGYELKVEDITIRESEDSKDSYDFTVVLKKFGGSDNKTITLQGAIKMNEEGKIIEFSYSNDQEKILDDIYETESEQNIRAMLQEEFNGPDEGLGNILNGLYSDSMDKDKMKMYEKKYSDYVDENLQSYFNLSDKAVMEKAYKFLRRAYYNDYKLKVEDITVKDREWDQSAYNFSVDVTFTKNESSDSKTINISGMMDTDNDSKIVKILYHNSGELESALEK